MKIPNYLKNWAKYEGESEIDRVRELRFWRWLAIIGWIITAIVVYLWLFIPNLEAATPLSIAQSQIGLGEIGGNNRGIYVRQYLNGQENLPWCAGFISYCFKQVKYNLPYFLRAKSYLNYGEKIKKWQLSIGDIVIFNRKGGGHIGIIERIVNNGFVSIEGNVGNYPAKVKRVNHMFEDESILGFVRLARREK